MAVVSYVMGTSVGRGTDLVDPSIGEFHHRLVGPRELSLSHHRAYGSRTTAVRSSEGSPGSRSTSGFRLGTSTATAGPAGEPNVHPTIGAGVRIGRRFGVLAEVDRAGAFTLSRGGLFVGW